MCCYHRYWLKLKRPWEAKISYYQYSGWNIRIFIQLIFKCAFFLSLFKVTMQLFRWKFAKLFFSWWFLYIGNIFMQLFHQQSQKNTSSFGQQIFEIWKFFLIGCVNLKLFYQKSAKVASFHNWLSKYVIILPKISKSCFFS